MGTLQDIKYRSILELIKNEEPFDKKRKVISGLEAFNLCHKRYESLRNILTPLKNKLGKDIIITSINFTNGMQGELGIIIKYIKDRKLNMLAISILDLEINDFILSDSTFESDDFLTLNYDILLKAVNELDQFDYISNPEIFLKSTSNKFDISDNCHEFVIKSIDEKTFSIGNIHRLFDLDGKLFNPDKITSEYPKLLEELMNEENIKKIYSNLRIYENDFPKRLIKKIT